MTVIVRFHQSIIGSASDCLDWLYLRRYAWRCWRRPHDWADYDHWTMDAVGGGYLCQRCSGYRAWAESDDAVHY